MTIQELAKVVDDLRTRRHSALEAASSLGQKLNDLRVNHSKEVKVLADEIDKIMTGADELGAEIEKASSALAIELGFVPPKTVKKDDPDVIKDIALKGRESRGTWK